MTVYLNHNRFRFDGSCSRAGRFRPAERHIRQRGRVAHDSLQIKPGLIRGSAVRASLRQVVKDEPGVEYSLFATSAKEFVIARGSASKVSSHFQGALALAHTHTGSCMWSEEDMQILLAHAILNSGEEIEHTVLGEDGFLEAAFFVEEGELCIVSVQGESGLFENQLRRELSEQFSCLKDLPVEELENIASLDLSKRVENLLPNHWKVPKAGGDTQSFLEKIESPELIEMLGGIDVIDQLAVGESQVMTLKGRLYGEIIKHVSLSLGENPSNVYFHIYLKIMKTESGELRVVVQEVGGGNYTRVAKALFENQGIDWKQAKEEHREAYDLALEAKINEVFMRFVDDRSYYGTRGLSLKDETAENFLSKLAHSQWVDELLKGSGVERLEPGESQVVTLRGELNGEKIKHVLLSLGENPSNGYFHIYLKIMKTESGELRVVVQEVGGGNYTRVAKALFENRGIDWKQTKAEYREAYDLAWGAKLNEVFMKFVGGQDYYGRGYLSLKDETAENFLSKLRQEDLVDELLQVSGIENLEPGESQVVTLKGHLIGERIKFVSLSLGENHLSQYFHIYLKIMKTESGELRVVVQEVGGGNYTRVAKALFENRGIDWKQTKAEYREAYDLAWGAKLNEVFMRFVDDKANYGRGGLSLKDETAENFLSKLTQSQWADELLHGIGIENLELGESQVLTWKGQLKGEKIKYVSLSMGENPSNGYFHIYLKIMKTKGGDLNVFVYEVDGVNCSQVFNALYQNLALEFSSNLFYKFKVTQTNSERLLYSLSEFGRMEFLNEIRRLQGKGAAEVVDVDSEVLVKAALSLLGRYSQNYSDNAWDDSDKRFTVTKALGDFLSGYRMDRELATGVSEILQRGFEINRERQIQTFNRVKRKVGVSPIAESGWENFSPDLQDYLIDFSAQYLGSPTSSPAGELLRHPFNQMLGAAYYTLVDQGLSDLSHEILLHLYYQRRREDSLSEFYDGYQKQSGYDREYAIYNVQQDLKGFELAMSDLDLDVEEPFRIVEGTVAGASRFMWDVVLDRDLQKQMIQTARAVFPNHTFKDDNVLSNRLPQALFFEVQGRLCAAEHARLTAASIFEQKAKVLKLFLGLGADSILAFKRGYGSQSMRADFIKLLNDLKTKHPKEYKSLLEDHYVYEKNVVVDGAMRTQSVSLRLGDILEGLLKGLKLSDLSGALRYFRLHFKDEDESEQESEIDRLNRLLREEGVLSEEDQSWLVDLMEGYTRPPQGKLNYENFFNPPKGSRWYEVHPILDVDLAADDPRRSGTVQTMADHLLEVSLN